MRAVSQLALTNPILSLGPTAEKILEAFREALIARGVELPETQFVAPGADIAWEAEQFTVNLISMEQGQPGRAFAGTMVPKTTLFYATFAVNLLREVPGLSGEGHVQDMLPSPEEQQAAAFETINDAAMLALAAADVHGGYKITGPGEGFAVGPVTPFGPEGNLVGSRCLVSVSLT